MFFLSGRLDKVLLYVYEKMYDKEMQESQTEDQLTAPCGRDIEQTATSQLNLSNQRSLPQQDDCQTEKDTKEQHDKTRTQHKTSTRWKQQ